MNALAKLRQRARWLAASLLALALVLGSSAPARAQPDHRRPSAEEKESARTLMDTGRKREKGGDHEGALRAYLAADRIMQVPTTGLSVGRMQVELGRLAEARDTLLRVSRHPQQPGEPRPFTQARQRAEELAAELAGRVPSITFEIEGVPPDAEVTVRVNDAEVPTEALDLPRKVNPGRHVVVASAPGFRDARRVVNVEEGEEQVVALVLDAALPTDEGGDEAGEDEAGVHPLVWVGFGTAAVGLTVGVITGGVAASKSSELDDECPNKVCPPERESDLDALNAVAHTSTVFLVLGGIGAAVGVVSLVVLSADGDEDDGDDEARAPIVRLLAQPGGVTVSGRF